MHKNDNNDYFISLIFSSSDAKFIIGSQFNFGHFYDLLLVVLLSDGDPQTSLSRDIFSYARTNFISWHLITVFSKATVLRISHCTEQPQKNT